MNVILNIKEVEAEMNKQASDSAGSGGDMMRVLSDAYNEANARKRVCYAR